MNEAPIQEQFTAIYEAESNGIFRYCIVRVSDRDQALDLTQETFTRLWLTMNQGKRMTNHRAFLFTVAHHVIIDWYRKKKSLSLESMSADFDEEEYFDPVDESSFDKLGLKEEGRFLLGKIKDLGHSYQDVVYLRFVEGLSPPEIGEILGISANAASIRINRGIEELRKITGYGKSVNSES